MQTEATSKPAINPWSVWIPIIIAVLGVVVFYNYLISQNLKKDPDRPPYMGKLETNLGLVERSGKNVSLDELKGKILVMSYVYTRCPRGCAGVVAQMKALYDEYGSNPGIHFICFSVDPTDTPEILKEFASRYNITGDNWWFVNGSKDEIRNFLTFQAKFNAVKDIEEKDRLSPDDKFIHDLRVALIDNFGNVRGLYDIMNYDPEFAKFWNEKIRRDLDYLITEQKAKPYNP